MIEPGGRSIHKAIWSASPFMAWPYYTFVFSDFMLSSMLKSIEKAVTLEEVRSETAKWKEYYGYPEGEIVDFRRFLDDLRGIYGK